MLFEITVKLEINDFGGSFNSIERQVREKFAEGSQQMVADVFESYQTNWLAKHKSFRHKGASPIGYKTLVGEVAINRLRVVYKGTNIYPLDVWVGIEGKSRTTTGLRKQIEENVIEKSYRKASRDVGFYSNSKVSPMESWRIAQDAGEKQKSILNVVELPANPAVQIPVVFNTKTHCPVLCIDLDATYCKGRSMIDTRTKHEVKLAVMYTGKIDEIKKTKKNKKRLKLTDKTVLTARVGETLSSFLGRVSLIARHHYGANEKTIILIHGDGDPWISRMKYDYFPWAHTILDTWHLKKKLTYVFGEFLATEWMSKYIYSYEPVGLIDHLQKTFLESPAGLAPEHFESIEGIQTYLKNNIDGLIPILIPKHITPEQRLLFKRGSGTIERNIDLVIGERCKLKRMAWSKNGLENILVLRERMINRQSNSPLTAESQ